MDKLYIYIYIASIYIHVYIYIAHYPPWFQIQAHMEWLGYYLFNFHCNLYSSQNHLSGQCPL